MGDTHGATVTEVAARFGVARKTVHDWLAKYEPGGLENLGDRSHRPRSCPHQIGSDVEVAIARMRTSHPSWGPRRIAFALATSDLEPVPDHQHRNGDLECKRVSRIKRALLVEPMSRGTTTEPTQGFPEDGVRDSTSSWSGDGVARCARRAPPSVDD